MKKLFILLAVVGLSFSASAQQKIGHIDSSELIEMWPGKDIKVKELEALKAELDAVLQALQQDYMTKAQEIEGNQTTWPESMLKF